MTENEYGGDIKTVSRDGVTVERELTIDGDEITGTIDIESCRDDSMFVHVVEDLPAGLSVEDAAFEPASAPDIGDISPERISLRHNVADEPVRIRYWIATSNAAANGEWRSPFIEAVKKAELTRSTTGRATTRDSQTAPHPAVTGPDATSETGPPESGDSSPSGSEAAAAPGSETRESREQTPGDDSPDGAVESPAEGERGDEELTDRSTGDPDGRTTAGEREEGTPASGRARAAESGVPRSLHLRIDHLSARMQEFAAYTSSLQTLIDERGTASEIVDDLESNLDQLGERLDALQLEMESIRVSHDEDVEDIHASVDRIETAVDRVESEIDSLETEIAEHDGRFDDVRSDVATLENRLDAHDSSLDEVESDVGTLEERQETFGNRLDAFESDLEQFGETLETIEEELATPSEEVQTLAEELEGLRKKVDDLDEFRRSLAKLSEFGD
ncbi:MAG: hypothetical protein V5A28_09480 [Haloarculaceae archaeon]